MSATSRRFEDLENRMRETEKRIAALEGAPAEQPAGKLILTKEIGGFTFFSTQFIQDQHQLHIRRIGKNDPRFPLWFLTADMAQELEALYAISENSANPLSLASPGIFPFFPFRIYEDRGEQLLSDHYETPDNAYFGYEQLVLYRLPIGGTGTKPWFEEHESLVGAFKLINGNRPLFKEHGPLDIRKCEDTVASYLENFSNQQAMTGFPG